MIYDNRNFRAGISINPTNTTAALEVFKKLKTKLGTLTKKNYEDIVITILKTQLKASQDLFIVPKANTETSVHAEFQSFSKKNRCRSILELKTLTNLWFK